MLSLNYWYNLNESLTGRTRCCREDTSHMLDLLGLWNPGLYSPVVLQRDVSFKHKPKPSFILACHRLLRKIILISFSWCDLEPSTFVILTSESDSWCRLSAKLLAECLLLCYLVREETDVLLFYLSEFMWFANLGFRAEVRIHWAPICICSIHESKRLLWSALSRSTHHPSNVDLARILRAAEGWYSSETET